MIELYVGAVIGILIAGIYCIATKKNLIKAIIGIEIITSAINLNFLVFGSYLGLVDSLAQSMVVMSIVLGATVAAVALSIAINVYRHYKSLDLEKMNKLRG